MRYFKAINYLVATTTLILVCGCTSSKITLTNKATFTTSEEVIKNDKLPIVGAKGLLLADNQKAKVLTEPIFEQSQTAESAANTAHRRPSLDEFSLNVLAYILGENSHEFVIHGGDLLNNSCLSEFKDSVAVLNKYSKQWFLAPGNHDGYLLGISSPMHISRSFNPFRNGLLDERAGWALACTNIINKRKNGTTGFFDIKNYEKYEDLVVDKRTFNRLYLNEIGVVTSGSIDYQKSLKGVYEGYNLKCKSYKGRPHRGYLKEVCWTEYDSGNSNYEATNNFTFSGEHGLYKQWEEFTPWKNFIVQRLEVPKSKNEALEIIILDTSSYSNGRAINEVGEYKLNSFGAADAGNLPREEREIVESWLKNSSASEVILVGHHPLLDFDKESFEFILNLKSNFPVSMYISGDTHDGYDVVQSMEAYSNQIREVNLGSTIDAPIEYAILGESIDETGSIIKRYSLTPLEETRKKKTGVKKTNVIKGLRKNYAIFNDKIWSECHSQDWIFSHDNSLYNPLGLTNKKLFHNFKPLARPSDWLGIHYVLNPFSIRDVRNKSLAAYKISRLVYLAEVYHSFMAYYGIEKSANLLALEKQVKESLQYVTGKEFSFYNNADDDPFNEVLLNLDILIQEFRRDTQTVKSPNYFKVCAALYDAEREYRDSFLEKLND